MHGDIGDVIATSSFSVVTMSNLVLPQKKSFSIPTETAVVKNVSLTLYTLNQIYHRVRSILL